MRYLHLAGRYWPLALVLSCGLVFGYFLARTYIDPLPRQYQLDFRGAKWIEPPQFSPIAYFREKIFINASPELAWIQIAATDSYTLTINGKQVGLEDSLKTRVSGIYDIKSHLLPGTNVIAVEVSRTSYPGSAQLVVCGSIKQPGRDEVPITSDERWKVTNDTGIVEGSEAWNSPQVQDEIWPSARLTTDIERPQINWVSTNPLLLQLFPAGKWLLARNAPREAIFSTSFEAKRSGQETWIQVASSGGLDLLVNNHLVTSVPTAALKAKLLPRLPASTLAPPKSSEQEPSSDISTAASGSTGALSMEAYDISRWVRRGANQIVAAVRSAQNPAMFFGEGFTIFKNGSVQRFQTDSTWQSLRLLSHGQAPESRAAVEAGYNGSAPWGYLLEGHIKEPQLADFDTIARWCAVALGTLLATLSAWLVASWSAAVLREEPTRTARARDALFHVPITIAMLCLLLLSCDYRFPSDWAFQSQFCVGIVAALAAVRLLHFLASSRSSAMIRPLVRIKRVHLREAIPYLILAGIILLGFGLRYHNLAFMSFDHDEMSLILRARGVFVRGYPCNEYGGIVTPATTYELVSYILALSGRIFGYSEWSMRLPSCLWGTLTIGAVALMGRRLFNWRTGLIAALIYACLTVNIRWAQNAFYPQQLQFMSMLTVWLFYEAIRIRPFHRKFLTAASVAFCLAFVSWEGCGFLLPAFFIALMVVRWGEWWWLKNWHLYRCLFFIAALVIAQFCWRTILSTPPYLTIGSGLSNVAGPSLFFINYAYQPSFYVEKLLLAENHVIFTIMASLGIFFCWRQAAFRYIVTVLLCLMFLYTNFLQALSPRYCYFYQPLLLLAGAAATVTLYDRLVAIVFREGNSIVAQSIAHASGMAMIALLFIQSNEWLIRAYSLSADKDGPGLMGRMGSYRYDYRSADQFVKSHLQPGDIIIPIVPHVFEYYTGIQGDFFLDTLLGKKVSYDWQLAEPAFIDKFRGYRTIRSLTELLEATHRGRRTWIVYVPSGGLIMSSSPDVRDYLTSNAKTVYESYRAQVYLIQGANTPNNLTQSNEP